MRARDALKAMYLQSDQIRWIFSRHAMRFECFVGSHGQQLKGSVVKLMGSARRWAKAGVGKHEAEVDSQVQRGSELQLYTALCQVQCSWMAHSLMHGHCCIASVTSRDCIQACLAWCRQMFMCACPKDAAQPVPGLQLLPITGRNASIQTAICHKWVISYRLTLFP